MLQNREKYMEAVEDGPHRSDRRRLAQWLAQWLEEEVGDRMVTTCAWSTPNMSTRSTERGPGDSRNLAAVHVSAEVNEVCSRAMQLLLCRVLPSNLGFRSLEISRSVLEKMSI